MHALIADNLAAIRDLGKAYGVLRLEVFGSVCTDEFDPERSDIDFLVEYPAGYDFGPWDARKHALQQALAALLEREVDLVETRALRNRWFAEAAAETRQVIYEADTAVIARPA